MNFFKNLIFNIYFAHEIYFFSVKKNQKKEIRILEIYLSDFYL